MRQTRLAVSVWSLLCLGAHAADYSDASLYQSKLTVAGNIRSAMLASIRTSWEQGTAAGGILEFDDSEYSVFGSSPFVYCGISPLSTLQLAYSAAVRQSSDGRLSQEIGDAQDGAALDGASAGSAVLLGSFTDTSRHNYWLNAADAQLNFILNVAPRTSTGAISHRADSRQYWADGVYMGFPFIAYFGAVTNNATLLQIAYDQCRLYRDALILDGPTGKLWGHIYSDDTKEWIDEGIWGTGNAWAALGMLRVAVTIQKTEHSSMMASQIAALTSWIKEILDGEFAALTSDNLIPDYITGGPSFSDAASSAALASVAYRVAHLYPHQFGSNYTDVAAKIRNAVVGNITNLGTLQPIVDPLAWTQTGLLSTESQAFGLMMFAAWRDWIGV
ncbi:Six-hairpin glycosidase-like protein [Suillus clintonianus]|uniref:Six-hairpin glycosidase-like protein n=1 Tax=Suillus clintonianus TaxID=1904413 RepID=UPI001B877077|nr:Six-hairpin glycosidase-like protein [Suillus clintonianus]KAG2123805.1 Six-hairpin glycosidase-like protein [Suillus clintonianus]